MLTYKHVITYCLGDPFAIEGVTLSPVPSVSVNVTAVNCLGQRAEVTILYKNFFMGLIRF